MESREWCTEKGKLGMDSWTWTRLCSHNSTTCCLGTISSCWSQPSSSSRWLRAPASTWATWGTSRRR